MILERPSSDATYKKIIINSKSEQSTNMPSQANKPEAAELEGAGSCSHGDVSDPEPVSDGDEGVLSWQAARTTSHQPAKKGQPKAGQQQKPWKSNLLTSLTQTHDSYNLKMNMLLKIQQVLKIVLSVCRCCGLA